MSIKDPKGNITTFTYDYAGRQLSRTLPMGQKETVEYNRYGQLSKQIDFKGQITEFIYDTLGRQLSQKYFAAGSSSATEEITFTYDDLGRTKTIVTPQGTTENTYNARGELVQVSSPEGSINYAYDVKTGAKTRVWTLNSDIRYTYDAMNRLKTVEVRKRNGVELGTPEVTTYDYTKVGSRASVSLPNGITTSYQYDSLNRLMNLSHKKADTLIASYTYSLQPAGRRSAVTEVTPEGTSQINYTYDNLYRLTHETRTGVNSFTASYAYDINSNRTQKVETVNGITETINYEYNANDQLLSEVSSANGTTIYTYDVNGSLTTKANEGKFSYQYGYDLRNRLATANITRKEGTADVTITSSYAYNADGIRTRALQTINGITQNRYFLLDDGHTDYAQVFEETAELGGSIVRNYTIGDDVLSQTVAGVSSHLLYDGHGCTRQLVDSDGGVRANYAYDAYGKILGGNPGVTDGKQSATDLLYAGEQFDPGLQMEYLRARYYDQDNGRFNRLDPFEGNSEDPQSLHKYAYAHCDPINGIDPSGNMNLGELNAVASIQTTLTTIATPTIIIAKNNMSTVARGAAFVCNLGQQVISKGGTIITQGQRIANAAGEFIGRYKIDLLVRNNSRNIMIEGKGVPWHLYKSSTAWESYLRQLGQQANAFKNATQTAGNVINERVIVFSSKAPKGFEKATDDIYRVLGKTYDSILWSIDDFIVWVDKL